MEGENKPQDRKPQEQRSQGGEGSNRSGAEAGTRDRNRGRKSGGGGRRSHYRFEDDMEHAICLQVTHEAPQAFPAVRRVELATMPPREVARTETTVLLCDRQHQGPHLWPNGDEVI